MSRRTTSRRSSLLARLNPFAVRNVDRAMEFKRSRQPRFEPLEDRRMLAVLIGPSDDLEQFNDFQVPGGQYLGSEPTYSIQNFHLSGGEGGDSSDTFIYRAHSTGRLLVQATTDGPDGFSVDVQDSLGNSFLVTPLGSGVATTIPVIEGQNYWIVVNDTNIDDSNDETYHMELENLPAPIPASVSLAPASDTGVSNRDGITSDNTPMFFIQDDLVTFLVPPANGGNTGTIDSNGALGYDVELVITNLENGDVTTVNATQLGSSAVWRATAPTLVDGEYLVSARTRVDDASFHTGFPEGIGPGNPAASLPPGEGMPTGYSLLSVPIFITIDAVADAGTGTIDLLPTSDSGMLGTDNVTKLIQPAFSGVGPQNSIVRVFAQQTNAAGVPVGTPSLIGTGTVGSDLTDGVAGDGQGLWEVTVEPLIDGRYNIFAQFETAAGLLSARVPLSGQSFTNAPALAIPDVTTVTAQQDLSGQGLMLIDDLNIQINIDHTFVGDIEITLISPNGTRVLLTDNRGGGGMNFTNTVFDDSAAASITTIVAAGAPFTGVFRPEQPLSALIGEDPNGIWQLEIVDNVGGDAGTLVDWTLTFSESVYIDTAAPNTPFLDLTIDSGRNNADNITNTNLPTFVMLSNDTVNGGATNPFPNDVKFRLYVRPGGAVGSPEILVYDSFTDLGGFTTLAAITQQISLTLNDPNGTPLPDGAYDFKLEIEDRAGNISHDFFLQVTVDTTAPPVSFGFPGVAGDGLLPDSDTGVVADPPTLNDRITSDSTPSFWGQAEANSVVRLFVDVNGDGAVDAGDRLIGQTVATPYDGNLAFTDGYWEITANVDLNDATLFPTKDGLRNLLVTAEDQAGNVNLPDDMIDDGFQTLDIFLDTQGPQVNGIFVTGERDYDLLDPKPSEDGFTPLITSIDIDFIDQPIRGEGGVMMATGFIDLIVVMDESGSMSGEQAFIGGFIQTLDAALIAAGVGAGANSNQYGLVGYGNSIDDVADLGRTILVGGGLFGSDDQFAAATSELVVSGGFEDGYAGVDFALQNYAFRAGSTPIIVLVTDEDRDNGNAALNSATFVMDIMSAGASLVSIVDANLRTSSSDIALAIDSLTNAYVEQPGGTFIVSAGGTASGGDGNTVVDYVDTAFMVDGFAADLNQLRNGGNSAASFSNALLTGILGIAGGGGFVYPAVNEAIATIAGRYQLVGDHVGPIAITPGMIQFLDSTVSGDIGRTTIRLNFNQPLPDDRYTLTIIDSLTDDPGNRLDGESNASEPQDDVTFPSGDGVPGGNFVARFTVDSRPEIGTYIPQGITIDINGNFVWDPANAQIGNDATNVDLTFLMDRPSDLPGGFASHDLVFNGQFLNIGGNGGGGNGGPQAGVLAPDRIFDQLAVYGYSYETGEHRWLIDFNSDGVADRYETQPLLGSFGLNVPGAIPVAGNFDGIAANGDEIGLYYGGNWGFDFNRNFRIDAGEVVLGTGLFGAPVVGDFDGNGIDDVAVFNNDVFTFAFSTGAFGNFTSTRTLNWGFPGVLDRPVVGDMNQDGVDDISLFIPRNSSQVPREQAEWYFLISDRSVGVTPGTLNAFDTAFSIVPFGNELYAEFGDELALPLIGNFDPPVVQTSVDPQAVDNLPGDYDGNGYVDVDDRMVWRAQFGQSGSGMTADGNGDGRVDIADYSIWRDNLGSGNMPATVLAATMGDYNGDGNVDQDDNAIWRSQYGQSGAGLSADGNRDGRVDMADYNVWRDNLGATISLPAALTLGGESSGSADGAGSSASGVAARARAAAMVSTYSSLGTQVAPSRFSPTTTDAVFSQQQDNLLLIRDQATPTDKYEDDQASDFDLFEIASHDESDGDAWLSKPDAKHPLSGKLNR